MNNKKRSQSSLRSKTQQSQDSQLQQNFWIGNLQSQKSRHMRAHHNYNYNIASSMIQQCNKQNQECNQRDGFISVQELSNRSEILQITPMTDKSRISSSKMGLQVTPQNLQKQQFKVNTSFNTQQNKPYNYVEQYYQAQLQTLQLKLTQSEVQLRRYQNMYSNKQEQLSGLSQGLTERIQKENIEKNTLIKEINCNNIEIKRLKDQIQLHKSQKDTLKIVLKEKENMIQELSNSIVQTETNKKKVQGYQMQLRQSQSGLQQIQSQLIKFKAEADKKDSVIAVANKKISSLQQKLQKYESQIKLLQQSTLSLRQMSMGEQQKVSQIQKQCQQWKDKYCAVKLQVQQIPELQIRIKNTQLTVDDLQARLKQLISVNEKLKIEVGGHQSCKYKISEFQKEQTALKKQIREKCEQIQILQNKWKISKTVEEQLEYFKNRLQSAQKDLQQRDNQIRKLKLRLETSEHKTSSLTTQLQQIKKQSARYRELQQKIDRLFNENQKLHKNLLQKLSEFEQLQRKINILESKNIMLTNQNMKMKSSNQKLHQQVTQREQKYLNMKSRWETQIGVKISLEQKCQRFAREIVSINTQLCTAQQNNSRLNEKCQEVMSEFEQKKLELYMQLDELNNYKIVAQNQLDLSRSKLSSLQFDLQNLKHHLDESLQVQSSHLSKIGNLETLIASLTEQVRQYKAKEDKMRKYWGQISQISNVALVTHSQNR